MVLISSIIIIFSALSIRYAKPSGGGYIGYNKENTDALKGFLALYVLLSHLTGKVEYELPLIGLSCMGAIGVGCFFFLSGYALAVSQEVKPEYAKTFLPRRLKQILFPYLVLLVCYFVLGWCVGFSTPADFMQSFLNGAPVSNSWYVFGAAYCYILFWLAYGVIKKHRLFIVSLGIAGYIIAIAFLSDWGDWWYKSIISFPVGLAWGMYRKQISAWLNRQYFVKLVAAIVFFSFSYLLPAINNRVGLINSGNIWLWNDVLMSLSGTLVLGVFLVRFSVKNKMTSFLGSISYEIYLWHGLLMELIIAIWKTYQHSHFYQELFAVLIVAITVIVSIAAHKIDKLILSKSLIVKNGDK